MMPPWRGVDKKKTCMMASSWRRGEAHGQVCAASPPRDVATARQRRSAARNTYEAYVHRKEKRAVASEDTAAVTPPVTPTVAAMEEEVLVAAVVVTPPVVPERLAAVTGSGKRQAVTGARKSEPGVTPDNADEKETTETKETIVVQAAVTPPRRGLRGAKHGLSRGSEVKGITRLKEADKQTRTYALDLYKKMALRQAHAVV